MAESNRILLAHGGGGLQSQRLVSEIMLATFSNPILDALGDSAVLPDMCGRLAMTTDGYVVHPRFFPGGNIGRLAVCGTVNDLAVAGALPRYLSVGMIIEEGFSVDELRQVVQAMAEAAREAGVAIVTGDTKVVPRGQADGLFITTAGVGVIPMERHLSPTLIKPSDQILLSGTVGDHGMSIVVAREGLGQITHSVTSDCAPLASLVSDILAAAPATRCLRDPTRGGVAATINEWVQASRLNLRLNDEAVPVRPEVASLCEMLGFDPLHLANEGKLLAVVPAVQADAALAAAKHHPLGRNAALIGEVIAPTMQSRATVVTAYGTERILDWPSGELLPRIC